MNTKATAFVLLAGLLTLGCVGVTSAQTDGEAGIKINVSDSAVVGEDLAVEVRYANNTSVRNATVVFNGTEHLTDNEGRVVVTPRSVGSFEVVARKHGRDARGEVMVVPELRIELSRRVVPLAVETPVRVTVTYAHNDSLAEGARVRAGGRTARTGENGSAVVLAEPTQEFGTVTVSASREDAASTEALLNTSGAYVFGVSTESQMYWTLVFLFAFAVVVAVVLNQLVSDTLMLKE